MPLLVQAPVEVKVSTRFTDRRGPLGRTTRFSTNGCVAYMNFISIPRHGAIVVGVTLPVAYLAVLLSPFDL